MGGDKHLTVHPRPNIDGVASYKTDISFMKLNFRQHEPVREEEAWTWWCWVFGVALASSSWCLTWLLRLASLPWSCFLHIREGVNAGLHPLLNRAVTVVNRGSRNWGLWLILCVLRCQKGLFFLQAFHCNNWSLFYSTSHASVSVLTSTLHSISPQSACEFVSRRVQPSIYQYSWVSCGLAEMFLQQSWFSRVAENENRPFWGVSSLICALLHPFMNFSCCQWAERNERTWWNGMNMAQWQRDDRKQMRVWQSKWNINNIWFNHTQP